MINETSLKYFDLNGFQKEVATILKSEFEEATPQSEDESEEQSLSNEMERVRSIADDKTFKKYLCQALDKGTEDAFEMAKTLSPVIVTLALTGVIAVPATPVFVAALSLFLTRMGIAVYCSDK